MHACRRRDARLCARAQGASVEVCPCGCHGEDLESLFQLTPDPMNVGLNPISIVARVLAYIAEHPGTARSSVVNHLGSQFGERADSVASAIAYLVHRELIVESVSYRTYADVIEGPTRIWVVW
jgi:hypothetical protein